MNIRRAAQNWLQSRHIELRKAPSISFQPVPVFDLAVERLMQIRGDSLRFIQVGANDGVFGDPLRKYVLGRGWSGILCEPQTDVFKRLMANYADQADRLIFENVAVSGSAEPITLYRAPKELAPGESMPHSLTVTSENARIVARQAKVAEGDLVKFEIPTVTLDQLIERHSYRGFDVLQIDVEGFDLEVLKTISLGAHRPGVIQFEHGHLSPEHVTQACRLLSENRYCVHYGGRLTDTVAMPEELFEG